MHTDKSFCGQPRSSSHALIALNPKVRVPPLFVRKVSLISFSFFFFVQANSGLLTTRALRGPWHHFHIHVMRIIPWYSGRLDIRRRGLAWLGRPHAVFSVVRNRQVNPHIPTRAVALLWVPRYMVSFQGTGRCTGKEQVRGGRGKVTRMAQFKQAAAGGWLHVLSPPNQS